MEHIIAQNVYYVTSKINNILCKFQYGFRTFRSCESQIISLVYQLWNSNDKNVHSNGYDYNGFCYFKSIWQGPHCGLISQISNWINSFFCSHTNCSFIKQFFWPNARYICRPSRDCCWPVLFIIYINDLQEYMYIKHSNIRLLADDIIIHREIKDKFDSCKLQEDLEGSEKLG